MSVFLLSPTTQTYEWGKVGLSSRVAQLSQASGSKIDESKPYAELWMGTHPTSPSTLASDPQTLLSTHLAANPHLTTGGGAPSPRPGILPFLLKVLSIRKALSIQTHPSKEMARRLHAGRGDLYKDDNHKPEMALALTPFTALVGFAPLATIAKHLEATPELSALVPKDILTTFLSLSASSPTPTASAQQKAALRDVFASIMTASTSLVSEQLTLLLARYASNAPVANSSVVDVTIPPLVQTLAKAYPGDVGCFCAFLLNYVKLHPGEAVFLGAGEPHAYLEGDIIEAMAASDNVIRAGLTPKLRDVPNLIEGLTYIPAEHTAHQVSPTPFGDDNNSGSTLYDPPIDEFSVVRTVLDGGSKQRHGHRAVNGPSIVVVTEGKGTVSWPESSPDEEVLNLKMGDVFFVGSGVPVAFEAGGDGLVCYRAFCE